MADWEDWEAEADKKTTETKEVKKPVVTKFGEEAEAVDLEEKAQPVITSQPRNKDKEAEKEKQKNIGKKWEAQEKKYDDVFNDKRGPLTADERKQAELSKESDQKNIIDSFGGFIEQSSKHDLKTEQAFVDFAKQISAIILKEDRKKYVQEFVKELLTQVYPKLTSLEYEDIHSKCTILFNQKQKEEKGPGTKKKGNTSTAIVESKFLGPAAKVNTSKANQAAKNMGYSDEEDEDYNTGVKYNDDDFM